MIDTRMKCRVCLLASLFLSSACDKKSTSKADSSASSATETATQAATATTTADATSLVDKFCANVGKVNLRTDVSQQLAILCGGSSASTGFKDLYAKGAAATGDTAELTTIKAQEDDDGFSQVVVVSGFKVSRRIPDFRDSPLLDSLGATYSSDSIEQTATVTRNSDDSLDSGLHILSADFAYDMRIKNDKGLDLSNKRNTQFNLYQVKSGDQSLGLAVEHLTDTKSDDYRRATMLNAALAAPDGNGTVIVTVLDFSLFNRNFHQTAVDSIREVARNASSAMSKALQ